MRVMRKWNWMVTAFLLLSLSAMAQQPAETHVTDAAASQTSQPSQPAAGQPAATSPAPQTQPASSQAAPASQSASPTTMDQVVDRFIEREHGLMKMLENRNPVDRKSTRLNSSHLGISYAVFCLK